MINESYTEKLDGKIIRDQQNAKAISAIARPYDALINNVEGSVVRKKNVRQLNSIERRRQEELRGKQHDYNRMQNLVGRLYIEKYNVKMLSKGINKILKDNVLDEDVRSELENLINKVQ